MNGPLPLGTQRAGRYEIMKPVGGGGMGDVFVVFDPVRRRELALKVLKFSYPRALHYFKREFRAIARLHHRNLVTLYDLHNEDGRYFYTMELIEGVDLYVHINESNAIYEDPKILALPKRQARIRAAFVQLLRGLAYMHAHGCIHRDLKPSNVMVDKNGVTKILDFGIVKELLPGSEGQSLSQVFGTATYMSPEQSQGSRVTTATDVYAAGVVLYELLAGVPPFDGEPQLVMGLHRNTKPPSLVQRVPGIDPQLALVCMYLLEKDPAERPSAREALEMLGEEMDVELAVELEFVGRRQARKVLHEALEAVRGGHGRTVVLEGPSGSGKSALAKAFCAEARIFEAVQFSGVCVHRDHVAARGLDTIVERIAEAWRRSTAEALRALPAIDRAATMTTFPFLSELLPKSYHVGMDEHPPGGPYAAAGLAALLTELCRKRLLVIVLEHLHLADDVTLELLEHLLKPAFTPPILFLITVRPEAIVPDSRVSQFMDQIDHSPNAQRLPLLPLLPDETRRLIQTHLPLSTPAQADQLHAESGGDPLFLTSLLQAMLRDPSAPVPRVDALVQQTVARLDGFARTVLHVVSAGRYALPGSVLQGASMLAADVMYEALDRLDSEDLVRTFANAEGEVTVSPVHARLMELVRRNVSTEELNQVHSRLAQAYEAAGGPAAAIAHHWALAGEPGRAPGFALKAAEEARLAGHDGRAADLLGLVVNTPPAGTDELDLREKHIDALARAGRFVEAAASIDRLLSGQRPPREDQRPGGDGHFHLLRAEMRLLAGQYSAFILEEPSLPLGPARARLAELLVPMDPSRAEALLQNLDTPHASLVRALLAVDIDATGRFAVRATKLWREATLQTHDLRLAVFVRASMLRAEGQFADARAVVDEGLSRLADAEKDPAHVRLRLLRTELALDLGDLNGARQRVRALNAESRLRGLPLLWVQICRLSALVHLESGEHQAAERRLLEADAAWPKEPLTLPVVHVALARARHAFVSSGAAQGAAALRRLEEYAPYQRLLQRRGPANETALLHARIAAVRTAERWRSRDVVGLPSAREALQERLRLLRLVAPPPIGWLEVLTAVSELAGGQPAAVVERLERFVSRPGEPCVRAAAAHVLSVARTDPQERQADALKAANMLRDVGAAPSPEAVALGAVAR